MNLARTSSVESMMRRSSGWGGPRSSGASKDTLGVAPWRIMAADPFLSFRLGCEQALYIALGSADDFSQETHSCTDPIFSKAVIESPVSCAVSLARGRSGIGPA